MKKLLALCLLFCSQVSYASEVNLKTVITAHVLARTMVAASGVTAVALGAAHMYNSCFSGVEDNNVTGDSTCRFDSCLAGGLVVLAGFDSIYCAYRMGKSQANIYKSKN